VAWHTAAVTSPRTLDPAEDSRLVEACLAGEPRAWEALVRRHERLVHAVARSYRLSDADIGDVFQEVFAALVAGLPRLRESRALVRWLSSTTQRIARATALRQRREQALSTGVDEISGLTAGDPSEDAKAMNIAGATTVLSKDQVWQALYPAILKGVQRVQNPV